MDIYDLSSVNEIIEFVENEQECDPYYAAYRVLIREIKRLKARQNAVRLGIIELQNGEFDEGCDGDLTVVNKSSCEVLYKLIE